MREYSLSYNTLSRKYTIAVAGEAVAIVTNKSDASMFAASPIVFQSLQNMLTVYKTQGKFTPEFIKQIETFIDNTNTVINESLEQTLKRIQS